MATGGWWMNRWMDGPEASFGGNKIDPIELLDDLLPAGHAQAFSYVSVAVFQDTGGGGTRSRYTFVII